MPRAAFTPDFRFQLYFLTLVRFEFKTSPTKIVLRGFDAAVTLFFFLHDTEIRRRCLMIRYADGGFFPRRYFSCRYAIARTLRARV